MSAEERREHSRGELPERTVRWRAKQGCSAGNPQAWESMTFPHPSLLALDALTILSRRSDAFYCLSNKVYNLYNRIPDLLWISLTLPFPFLSAWCFIHASLSPSQIYELPGTPFYLNTGLLIWILWPLSMHNYGENEHFMTSNPFHKTIAQKLPRALHCQSHLWKQVLFSCLWLPVRFVVSLKKSYPITDCFMQKEGAEPLKVTSVTQVLNYFSQYVIFCVFPLLRKTTRWLARVCTVHVYVLLFMRLDTISAKSWFVSL